MDLSERIIGLVSEGLCPSRIAKELDLRVNEIITVIHTAISNGKLKRSDVIASFDKDWRGLVDTWADYGNPIAPDKMIAMLELLDMPHDVQELSLYLDYQKQHATLGDTYQLLSDLERMLHALFKSVLVKKFGAGDARWWAQCIPETVRISCAQNRERDQGYQEHPYAYTTLMDLWTILDKQWSVLNTHFLTEVTKDKKQLERDWKKLNSLRNRVMHPVRGEPPSDEDYDFAKEMKRKLQPKIT